jgi:OmpA-OmpF porin, OOP family
MKEFRNFGRYLVLLSSVMALAGCASWSYSPPLRGNPITGLWNVPSAQSMAPQNPQNFSGALTSDYAEFAVTLRDKLGDWADADYFARKGLAAGHGQIVPPENNGNWLIPLEVPEHYRTMLSDARTHLVTVLDAGARDRMPIVAARAQVSYDCWVERMEDDWWDAANGDCRKQFEAAMAQLEGAPQPPAAAQPAPPAAVVEFRIYFEFDKYNLMPEAQQIVMRIAQQAKSGVRIHLIGKADLAGTDRYNLGLSQRRADTVKAALVRAGVPASQIDEKWVGDSQPPVPTPKGVREPRNRVVEVNLQ